MVFSSVFFLCFFLPLVLLFYWVIPIKRKNLYLLIASLFFYAWGEPKMVFVMLFVITVNYITGLLIEKGWGKLGVAISAVTSLGTLAFFKYANFAHTNVIDLLTLFDLEPSWSTLPRIALPIGISFYVFQTLSYNIDVYRKAVKASHNYIDFATHVSFFPQLVAGPIIRYTDIEKQLRERTVNINDISLGVERFILGMAKKVLIANNCAIIADSVFNVSPEYISGGVAWVGIIVYTLQIYFDFSGYSDMAIGLARIFGFRFLENFNYPYISKSIKEFWHRWHISLSSWFRDYLYIPLGGNRLGSMRTYINLFVVFFVTGLWHGASWNFVVWGLWHGLFLIIERTSFSKLLGRLPKVIQHIYTMLVVVVGLVFFRADDLSHAVDYIGKMFSVTTGSVESIVFEPSNFINLNNIITIVLALIFIMPVYPALRKRITPVLEKSALNQAAYYGFLLLLLVFLMSNLSLATYNPFIYFKF